MALRRQGWLAWAVSGTASYLGYVPVRSQPLSLSFDEGKFQELLQTLDQASAEALSEPILSRPAGSLSLLVRPVSPCSAPLAAPSATRLSVWHNTWWCVGLTRQVVQVILCMMHCG